MKSKLTRTLLVALVAAGTSLSASASSAGNAYAYDIRVNSQDQAKPTVTYKLNAPASGGVVVQAYVDGTLVASKDGTANNNGVDNSVTFDLSQYYGTVTFKVVAKMSTAPGAWTVIPMGNAAIGGNISSIAINKNPESPTFGQIIVSKTGGDNIGLQVFNPNFTDANRKGITGGISSSIISGDQGNYAGLFQRVRFSDDGRLFALSNKYGSQGLYELDVNTLNASPVFQGTPSTTDGKITNNGTFVGGAGAGLDVWGSGANLKVAVVSNRSHAAASFGQKVSIYNLGTAKTWSGAPNATSDDTYNNKNMLLFAFLRPGFTQVAFDKDGQGVGVLGYAAGPSDTDRNYIHADAANLSMNFNSITDRIQDYKYNWTNAGAMAYNADRSVLAIGTNRVIRFYDVAVSAGGKPTFSHKAGYDISALDGMSGVTDANAHIDDIAFDYAGNVYFCVNGNNTVYAVAGPFAGTEFSVPAPAKYTYTKTNSVVIPAEENITIQLNEAKSYAGRSMVSLRWVGELKSNFDENGNLKPITQRKSMTYYEIYRDGKCIVTHYKASSYIDVDLKDGKHEYFIRAYGTSSDGKTLGYKDSNVIAPTIKRDPAMTVYYLENIYNYPIVTPDEKNQYAPSSNDVVKAEGLIRNMTLGQGKEGARGDMYRQGVFKIVDGKPTWFISQITDRDADMTADNGKPAINAYGSIQDGEQGGVITFDADDPRLTPSRMFTYNPMVNQSLAVFGAWSKAPFESTDTIPANGTLTMLLRANNNLGIASGAGNRYLDGIHMIGQVTCKVGGTPNAVVGKAFPNGIDFYKLSQDANHNPDERGDAQYYRTQYLNTSGTASGGRLFVPLNWSRDLYVFDYKGGAMELKKIYKAPSVTPGTENYAIPIEGRKDFLHVMRSDNVYYVNAETGEYTPLSMSESEKRSACGGTFVFNRELFYIHPTSDFSKNPGHFRIDMPTRKWDAQQRKFVTSYTEADFQAMVPQAAYVQDDFAESLMGGAGNSNGAFFGFADGEETKDGVTIPVKYIYQYIPGVRFAKYKFYPKNEFPPVQPDLDIVLVNKGSNDDKETKYNHYSPAAEEMSHYRVQYGWYPRPFEQEEGTDFVTHHYYYEVKDSKGNVVSSGTIPYEPGKTYYEMPPYEPGDLPAGKGVARNDEYTITVTPYYVNTTDSNDVRPGGSGVAKDVISYEPDVKPITAKPYENDGSNPDNPNQWRVDIDFDRAPRNPGEQEGSERIVPEEVSYFQIQYKEPGGDWTNIPDFTIHVGDQDYPCPDGKVPGDYDFKNDKGQLPGADPNNEPDCVGYYYPDHKPDPGTEYRVVAVYADENPVIRDEAEKTTGLDAWGSTGVESITVSDAADAVNVFPVPAVDYVTVQSANAINVLRVVNVNGAVVKAVSANGVNSLNLYVGDLAAGVYFVSVNNAAPVRIIKK